MKHWLTQNWRGILARLPLPTLALAASYGVGSFAALFVPLWVAVVQAAAFELTYIGLAIVEVPEAARRRRAAMISLAAVAVSVVYNSAAGYFHRNPAALLGLSFPEELGLAIAHGAPLAIVAYLVADLLLHTTPRDHARPRAQRRALVRRLTGLLRSTREQAADAMALRTEAVTLRTERDQATAESARLAARDARLTDETERLRGRLTEQAAETAQLSALIEAQSASADLDVRKVAQLLRDRGVSLRTIGDALGVSEKTIRNWTTDVRTNGHARLTKV